jgi:DNA-binding XRE family transcriptional regulator
MGNLNIGKLNGKIAEVGTTKAEIAKAIGIDRGTLSRRIETGALRICDIHAICEVLHLTGEEAKEIFLGG